MKKFLVFAALMLPLGLIAPFAGTAMAAPPVDRQQLNASVCAGNGSPIVNVTVLLTNDPDSGVMGNNWAIDTINRNIQISPTDASGVYCVVVRDSGSFVTSSGWSPGGTTQIVAGLTGTMQGGWSGTITGTFNPQWATNGNVGTIDASTDPSWLTRYFNAGYSYVQSYWGWVYQSGHGSTWYNTIDNTSGDITN